MKDNIFGDFTNLYELSKTLRFELKPIGETQKLLDENQVFGKDELVDESYRKIKPYLDALHVKFIEESLKNLTLDLSEAEMLFLERQKESDKEKKNKIREKLFGGDKNKGFFGKLRKNITDCFNDTGESWYNFYTKEFPDMRFGSCETNKKFTKSKGVKILEDKNNLNILSYLFGKEQEGENILVKQHIPNPKYKEGNGEKKFILEEINLFQSFKGFTTYFTNFNYSRENFYKSDGKSGRIATRIINDNLVFFLKNKRNFDEKYKHKSDFVDAFNDILKQKYEENINTFFNLNFYNSCYCGKQIEHYNKIIGELNSIINAKKQADYSKYIQEKKENKDIEFKKQDYPIFKEFHKQILSSKTKEQKFIEIKNFNDIKYYLKEFHEKNQEKNQVADVLINSLIQRFPEYDFGNIYLSKSSLNTISAKFFGSQNWFFVQEKLLKKIGKKNKNKKLDLPNFIKISDIATALDDVYQISDGDIFKKEFEDIKENDVFKKFLKIFIQELEKHILDNKKYFQELEKYVFKISDFSNNKEEKEKEIEYIKNYLDSSLNIYRMMKYFALEKGKKSVEGQYETDDIFYNDFKNFYTDNEIISYYNEFRNYLTKKPFSENKIKLNFENGHLMDGWDRNKEHDNYGSILRKNGEYYLVLQVNGKGNIFYEKKGSGIEEIKEAFELKNQEEYYEKMDYKFFSEAAKMIPKCSTQLNIVKKHFSNNDDSIVLERGKNIKENSNIIKPLEISKYIFDLNNYEYKKSYLKDCGEFFDINNRVKADSSKDNQIKIFQKEFYKLTSNYDLYKHSLTQWIDFCKSFLESYSSTTIFKFNFKKSDEYESLDEFYADVDKNTYAVNFKQKVSSEYIDKNIKAKNIYLFKIYNKDFSEKRTGRENLHTMYFKGLFEENNLKNIVLKLNGQAELFRRKASLKEKIDTERKTKIDVIKYKRYTQDKIFFHCPIKLNFAQNKQKVNEKILEYIIKNKDINIIGIDRGEKHLAYYSVVDKNGNILKDENGKLVKGSFNVIGGKDYYKELVKREDERKKARGSWKTIGNIKYLKQGYISQVVNKLAELIIKYNAIIIFEDLNSGFKRGRQKIERQVYQKLEKALIEKLNYLTFKDKNFGENGHYLSAYQLTEPFKTFDELGKQTGIIFYTDPSYTSITCPKCGFRKDLYLKYSNLKHAKGDIEKINSITFDGKRFVFEYNNKKVFSDRERKKNWRNPDNNNEWETVDNPITKNIIHLLEKYNIDFQSGNNLIGIIQNINEKELYKELFLNFNAILNIRNSSIGDNSKEGDFICCPACDFDSRKENEIGIENGDDNGAYNIARKGIIILKKINLAFEQKKNITKIKWEDMIVTQDDWDDFVSGE